MMPIPEYIHESYYRTKTNSGTARSPYDPEDDDIDPFDEDLEDIKYDDQIDITEEDD